MNPGLLNQGPRKLDTSMPIRAPGEDPWATPPTAQEMASAGPDPWATPPTPEEMGKSPAQRQSQQQPGKLEALGRGGLQGASLGFSDELRGLGNAIGGKLSNALGLEKHPESFSDLYKQGREWERTANSAAQKAHPGLYGGAELAGGIVPGAAATIATGGAAALPMALAQGGAAGAGYSNADSARGLARDTGIGVGVGAAGYGAGSMLGKTLSAVGRAASGRVGLAESRAAGKAADEIAAEIARARGSLGGEVQKGQRIVENLRRLAPDLSPEEQAAVAQLEQRLAQSTREALPGQVGTIATRDAELAALQQGASQSLKDRTAELLSPGEMKQQILTRALRYGPVAAGSALGHWMGGPLGGTVGALAGAGTRPMVRATLRMAKNPAVQKAVFGALEGATEPTATFLRRAIQAAASGPLTEAAIAP